MIQTIDRAITILFVLRSSGSLTLAQLGAELDLPVSTILSSIRQLHQGGLVDRDAATGQYRLGPAVLSLSRGYLDASELRLRSTRWVAELARLTTHAVRLAVPLQEDYVIIQHELRPDGTLQLNDLGLAVPLQGTAIGKIFLSYKAEPVSPTLQGPAQAETEQVRQTGLAEERYEVTNDDAAIAAAISDHTGKVIAAVALAAPSQEWPIPDNTVNALRQAAQHISKGLGAATWPPAFILSPTPSDPIEDETR